MHEKFLGVKILFKKIFQVIFDSGTSVDITIFCKLCRRSRDDLRRAFSGCICPGLSFWQWFRVPAVSSDPVRMLRPFAWLSFLPVFGLFCCRWASVRFCPSVPVLGRFRRSPCAFVLYTISIGRLSSAAGLYSFHFGRFRRS